MDAIEYWREQSNRSRVEIEATCRAIGAAGYLLGPYCPYSDAQRLAHLREVIAELRQVIGPAAHHLVRIPRTNLADDRDDVVEGAGSTAEVESTVRGREIVDPRICHGRAAPSPPTLYPSERDFFG